MELDYLVPMDQRRGEYYNCNSPGDLDDYSHTEHIYEELKDPPLPLPERTYKNKKPVRGPPGYSANAAAEDGERDHCSERKMRINSTYQTAEETHVHHGSEYPCCKRRKCFMIVISVFLLSGVTTAALMFHLLPEEPTKVAFSIFWPEVTGDASPAMKKVYFNQSYVVYPRQVLPLTTSVFTTPSHGVFLFSLSIFAGSDICSYRIENPVIPIILGRSSGNRIDGDTIGREMIVRLPAGTDLHILKSGFIHDHDNYFLNSWSGFSISGAMKAGVVFSAARVTSCSRKGTVVLPVVLVNEGGSYDVTSGVFTAPVAGDYYFSASVGTAGSRTVQASISVNGLPLGDIFRNSSTHDGPELLSRVVMVTLNAGDKMSMDLIQGDLYSSDVIRETSFMGFLYDPKQAEPNAWCLQTDRSYIGIGQFHLDPVPFTRILLSKGVYINRKFVVAINCSGIYYVHMNAGVLPQKKMLLRLKLNDHTVASIWRFSSVANVTGHDGFDTVGRSVLLNLRKGDKLHLSASGYEEFGIGSTLNTLTSFTGFLVYPTGL